MIALPKQIQNSQSGQILIIFLLILVVGLAIVLSIASRTVTDVRQTTTSDESNRAYFAAESGVENALKKIQETPGFITDTAAKKLEVSPNFTGVNQSSADVGVTALTVPANNVLIFPNKIAKDDVGQVNLIQDFNTLTTSGTGSQSPVSTYGNFSLQQTDGLTIYWGKFASPTPSPIPAIEVSIISCISNIVGDTKCSGTPDFHITKYTFDQDSIRVGTNNFCYSGASSGPGNFGPVTSSTGTSANYLYKVTVRFPLNSCNSDVVPVGDNPVLARIRLLYADADVAVGGTSQNTVPIAWTDNGKALPNQGSIITSIGSTPSGVNRKLTVTRLYPALPALFDYVLFNGSTNPLQK